MKRLSVKTFNDNPLTYRGAADSGAMNVMLNSLKDSTMRANVRGQRVSREIAQVANALHYQNIALAKAAMTAVFDIGTIREVGSNRAVWHSFYDSPPSLQGDGDTLNGLTHEAMYGQVVLNQSLISSKLPS